MLPYKSIIKLNRNHKTALYQQLAHQIIQLINKGTLVSGNKLPSSRWLAEELDLHRKTIVSGYDELIIQGWLETIPQKGTYVKKNLPKLQYKSLNIDKPNLIGTQAGFSFNKMKITKPTKYQEGIFYINDGIPDVRLSPSKEIGQYFKEVSGHTFLKSNLGYESPLGTKKLRQVLVNHIQETRGIQLTEDNILITRGSQMGIYLSAKAIIKPKDKVVVGVTNYKSADLTFESFGAHLLRVNVDEHGLITEQIEELCKYNTIKAVYVTSHHHHPTTVTLSANRRLHLLNLAQKYGFAIIEDDYDYDFHYNRSPILPLAAHDINAQVVYIGSLCKTVAPAYRIGYLIATKDFVDTCAEYRRYMDRQGDFMLEYAFAKFIESGSLHKHTNKVMKIYSERRTLFCTLLDEELKDYLTYIYPTGGMAVWLTLNKPYDWREVTKIAPKFGIEFGDWERYDYSKSGHQSIRMGFANYTKSEMTDLINRLRKLFKSIS